MKYLYPFLSALLVAVLLFPAGCERTPPDNGQPKAAIIDQLYLRQPNSDLTSGAARLLETAGFKVDLWQGNDVTVDFYRKLPSLGYSFIMLRVHSGLLVEISGGQAKPSKDVYLFTAEPYSTGKYAADQLSDKVSYAIMEENSPQVFAVNGKFIKDAKGTFDHTVILAMGCESFKYDELPMAFIEKGASAYIGWNDLVSLSYLDMVIPDLLKNYFTNGMSLTQGIGSTMNTLGHDPYYNSFLRYYPYDIGKLTIKELITD